MFQNHFDSKYSQPLSTTLGGISLALPLLCFGNQLHLPNKVSFLNLEFASDSSYF